MIAIPTVSNPVAAAATPGDLRQTNRWKRMVAHAMQHADDFVVQFEYRDRKGKWSRRVVSPIRFLSGGAMLGLCLCREEPRQFQLEYCRNLVLRFAHEILMPVPLVRLDEPAGVAQAAAGSE